MSVGAAIVESVAVLYGCLLLTFASCYALTLKETWVGPSETERKNTAASKLRFRFLTTCIYACSDRELV
jgi:hypothetical protein